MGSPSLLNDGQREQLKVMLKEGKTKEEITAFFKATYHLDLPKHVIYSARYLLNKETGKVQGPKKSRKAPGGGTANDSMENAAKDILKIMAQIHDGYQRIFKFLRLELIKSRGQVYDMMRGAGIEVPTENLED